jgi:hypothetical protein
VSSLVTSAAKGTHSPPSFAALRPSPRRS